MRCEDCVFWDRASLREHARRWLELAPLDTSKYEGKGYCRRHSPAASFPIVMCDDWCGEFKQKGKT